MDLVVTYNFCDQVICAVGFCLVLSYVILCISILNFVCGICDQEWYDFFLVLILDYWLELCCIIDFLIW
jgi:hypothetical protein